MMAAYKANPDKLQEMLDAIPADCDYGDWLRVGIALKHEGMSVEMWDRWSRTGSKYHPGECEAKWSGLNADSCTGATLCYIAKQYGYQPAGGGDGTFGIGDEIMCNYAQSSASMHNNAHNSICAEAVKPASTPAVDENKYEKMTETEQAAAVIEAMFEAGEHVAFCIGSMFFDDAKEKWMPGYGTLHLTKEAILAKLATGDTINETLETVNPDAGGWLACNPMNGRGKNGDSVTAYRHILVECDDMPLEAQERFLRDSMLPISAMVYSGRRSVHAAVRIGAKDLEEFNERKNELRQYLDSKKIPYDRVPMNPACMIRFPGVMRGDKRQQLLAVNIGAANWEEWQKLQKEKEEEANLLPTVDVCESLEHRTPRDPELIEGLLRKNRKMIISGASKAGKSFLVMELAAALAVGGEWLGYRCTKSKVLLLNMELPRDDFERRYADILEAMGIKKEELRGGVVVAHLRDYYDGLDVLTPRIIATAKKIGADAVIIDPLYRVMMGDENNAADMVMFCKNFNRICAETGAAVIYTHHHSKGQQGSKSMMDRASGSGVFARDPDALLDLTELQIDEEFRNAHYANLPSDFATGWRLEASLRGYRSPRPVDLFFNYPVHTIDRSGVLSELSPAGATAPKKAAKPADHTAQLVQAYNACSSDDGFGSSALVSAMASYCDVTDRTLKNWLSGNEKFKVNGGTVYMRT